jgi:peptidoglycan/LPS O-acetylase OafA/YrhL
MKNQYFPALTGIRAIAAYMVYIVHTDPFSVSKFGQNVFDFFDEFHIGVTIFFVLSGFLIAYNYFDQEKLNFRNYLTNLSDVFFAYDSNFFIFCFFKESKYNF